MGDLISRATAIKECHKSYDSILDFQSDGKTIVGTFEDIINGLPSVQPEPKWIPCSERLPEEYSEVLCCDKYGEYIIGTPYADEEADTGFCAECESTYMLDCIAWMSLPEPYKVERHENDRDKR